MCMSLKCEEEKIFDYVNNLKLLFIRKVQTKIKKKTSARILTVIKQRTGKTAKENCSTGKETADRKAVQKTNGDPR